MPFWHRLLSDTIYNASIVSQQKLAEVTIRLPLDRDLRAAVETLPRTAESERDAEVFVSALDDNATITMHVWADDDRAAEQLERELRVHARERLRETGIYA